MFTQKMFHNCGVWTEANTTFDAFELDVCLQSRLLPGVLSVQCVGLGAHLGVQNAAALKKPTC